MQDPAGTEFDADLARLDSGIRKLKVHYDMFFFGSMARPPLELRNEVEKIIREYTKKPIRQYAPRFQFNALVSRFNTLSEFWAKAMRSLEEGERPAPAVVDRIKSREKLVARCTVLDPAQERDNLELLHNRLIDARKKAGQADASLPFNSFLRSVSAQAAKLREKTGCDKVEVRIIVQDRKVAVKARPGR